MTRCVFSKVVYGCSRPPYWFSIYQSHLKLLYNDHIRITLLVPKKGTCLIGDPTGESVLYIIKKLLLSLFSTKLKTGGLLIGDPNSESVPMVE